MWQKKDKVIQHFLMRESTGSLAPIAVRSAPVSKAVKPTKHELAAFSPSNDLTLEVSKEVIRKLQEVR
jgi:hypothetical protein